MQADAREAYRRFVADLSFLSAENRDMAILGTSTLPRTLDRHRRAFRAFQARPPAAA
jgi:hypothetical protein